MKRRDFLRDTLLAAGVMLVPQNVPARVSAKPKKIVIIGGGLSGLVAAFELKKLGHQVTILEAQGRGGGRVHTFRGFAEGHWADAGAARIPKDHDITHRYVREFGLPLIPFYPTTNKFTRFRNGQPERVDWDKFAEATSMVMGIEQPDHWQKIKGGNDLLPAAFIERLRDSIQYNSPVVRIEQNAAGVTVKVDEKGKLRSLSSDLLIAAIPLTMLRNIEITPAFSDRKGSLIRTAEYDSASRVFLQTRDRFWLKQGMNGFAFGEKFDEVWDSTFGQDGTQGIIQSYSRSLVSSMLTKMPETERIESTLLSTEKLFPGLRSSFDKGVTKCWSEDPWVKGAWAHLTPDQKSSAMETEGRIVFAGEHLSDAPSWMQGALQSGLRAVDQVNQLQRA